MKKIKGLYTALVTPFDDEMKLDEEGLRHLIQRQLKAHVDGITIIGSTGEAPTLTRNEKIRMIQIAREEIQDKCELMVGTGTYDTRQVIEETCLASELGADSALVVTPYYNKPSQEGLYRHFKAITEETQLPLMIYNNPGRTAFNLDRSTLERLMDIPSIVGIKESASSMSQISEFVEIVRKARPSFSIMSGNDIETLPLMAYGGDGVISVLSNLLPKEVKALVDAIDGENYSLAREIHYQLAKVFKIIFIETNPAPIKAALAMYGFISGKCRLPLCELSKENECLLADVLKTKVAT